MWQFNLKRFLIPRPRVVVILWVVVVSMKYLSWVKAYNITTNQRQDYLLRNNGVIYFGKGKIIGLPLLNVVYPFSLKRKKMTEFLFGALVDINCTKMTLNESDARFQWYFANDCYHFKVSILGCFIWTYDNFKSTVWNNLTWRTVARWWSCLPPDVEQCNITY